LVVKPEGKRPLRRSRFKPEDYSKVDFREIYWGVMDWINLAQGRGRWRALMITVMNLRVPYSVRKFFGSCPTGGFFGNVGDI
jgi:hypothetical protein